MKKIISKKVFIIIFSILVIVALLFTAILYYIYKQSHRQWDTTKIITVQSEKPEETFYIIYSLCDAQSIGNGLLASDCDKATNDRNQVIIYLDKKLFIAEYKLQITKALKNTNAYSESKVNFYLEPIQAIKTKDVDIKSLPIELKKADDSAQLNFLYLTDDVVASALQKGNMSIYDLVNEEFLMNIQFRDIGFECGSLCGRGVKYYIIEGDRAFLVSKWIS
ncbi:MAG: hypothetical protein WCJ58_00025 [bacterium]